MYFLINSELLEYLLPDFSRLTVKSKNGQNGLKDLCLSETIFSMPSKVIITLPRAHFNPRLAVRTKMSLTRAQNKFMAANMNSIVLLQIGKP